ncbi:hypothetical protein AAG570_000582 [Ranatra chinensis]|uniref:SURP motif domain-containing protein n=1 Tax=Ranatra chinensis TaxID=642074 RepID=A0ABD0Z7V3_9HEMI
MIDSGQHLIPWMGDDSLKIDRYDGRGTLYDLASHEPNPTSFEQLTYDELETERLCDKERYRFLSKNEEEEAIYQEEEMKRFYQQTNAYSQVAYVYEDQALPTVEENPVSDDVTSQSKPFVLPTELSVPPDMTLPETMKLHAIIERTALFISQQGPQMEIIMKLKQHGNKQFDFLSHNDPLHPYYKLLLTSIKSGSYTPAEEKSWSDVEEQEEQDDNDKTSQKTEPEISADNPPDDVKKIVEVMVKYMAKNGPPFEVQIIKMCDSRFSFLNPSNKFYQYYQNRLKEAPKSEKWEPVKKEKEETKTVKEDPETENNDSNSSEKSVDKGLKRKPNPVCFSIKKAKENEGLEVPSALPLEDSSDENEQETSPKNTESGKVESSPESSEEKKVESRKRKSYGREKDAHIQKERKLKVAQFLKCLKNKQT